MTPLSRLPRLAASIDARVERLAQLGRLVAWPCAYGVALGVSAFAVRHPSRATELAHNTITPSEGTEMLGWCLGGLFVVAAFYRWAPTGGAPTGSLDLIRIWNARLRFVLALPFVAALAWPDTPAPEVLTFATLAALAAAMTVYQAPGVSVPRAPFAAPVAVACIFVAFVGLLGRLAITNYQAFGTRTMDLGLYDNLFWHCSHGDLLGTSLLLGGHHGSAHFDPILVLLSPLYRLRPAADSLLVLQIAWVGSTVAPLYLLARDRLRSPLCGVAFAAMYAAHPAVQGAALYEFHSLALASPLLVWLVYFLERASWRRYAVALALTLLCREDLGLLVCFVGAYAALRGDRASLRAGWLTALAGATYFVVVKRFFMDSFDPLNTGRESYDFAYYYADLIPAGNGAAGLATSLLTNPAFVVRSVLTEPKLEFLAVVLLPLGLLPLAARPARVMLVYGLLLCLLATKPAMFSIAFQYSCVLVPLAFAAAVIALDQASGWRIVGAYTLDPARLRRALLAFALVASALVSWKLGAVDPGHAFLAGYSPVVRSLDDATKERLAWVRAAVARIPPDASVGASYRLGPFISNRREAYDFPTRNVPRYVLVDDVELLFTPRPDVPASGPAVLRELVASGQLVEVDRLRTTALYRRSSPP